MILVKNVGIKKAPSVHGLPILIDNNVFFSTPSVSVFANCLEETFQIKNNPSFDKVETK
jgi:hypothetical protein